jgi:Ino eighty subunit 2
MFILFLFPAPSLPGRPAVPDIDADGDIKMETPQEQAQKVQVTVRAVCAVDGCTAKRKYRLVRDWERGACGMDHLYILERQLRSGRVVV